MEAKKIILIVPANKDAVRGKDRLLYDRNVHKKGELKRFFFFFALLAFSVRSDLTNTEC